jgi:hypothetical protein
MRWFLAVLCGVLGSLALASPASAHPADAPVASDYRCVVTGITTPLTGLTVRAVTAGTQLELVNRTGRTIEVLGYSGEPYLRVAPDGVYQNANSPATYLNQSATGGPAPPANASPAAPPAWQKLSATPAVLWHDHRAHWMATTRPPSVAADPGSPHRISSWSVPLRDGVREFAVTGTLDWVPPPAPGTWWAGGLLLAAAVAGLGLLRTPRALRVAAGVATVTGLAALGYAAAGMADSGPLGASGGLRALVTTQPWPLLCGLATVAAGSYAARRRPAADLALGLTGACVALYAGAGNAGVFAHAVPPVGLPGDGARLLVLLCVGGGAGLAGFTALRTAADKRRAYPGRGTPTGPVPQTSPAAPPS